jgi:lactoylglutathione lyase
MFIKGLYETHLNVSNLDRSIQFYKETLGLELCFSEEKRRAAFFWIGRPRQNMLGIWEKSVAEIIKQHFAFETSPEWVLNESIPFLKSNNLKFWNFLNDGIERPMVFAWMPAVSIYFGDPDGHELEFIGLLDGNSMPENGVLSHDDWLNTQKM